MKVFIFEDVEQVSDNYHAGGGILIVANNKDHAIKLIEQEDYVKVTEEEWEKVVVYELKNNEEPKVIVFPDAGCC